MTLAITAIVAAAALASVAFAAPQVMAHRYNHHNSNGIKVDQQVNQANVCSGQQPESAATAVNTTVLASTSSPSTLCLNVGSNSADIGH